MDAESGEEMSAPRRQRTPVEPTSAEKEEHEIAGHACFRAWCRHCIRGRAREWPHSQGFVDANGEVVPVVSFDYCFLCTKCNTEADEKEAEE